MSVTTARLWLFILWLAIWLLYVVMFFLTTTKNGVDFEQAADAAWKITYVLLPIVTAFASYWFVPSTNDQSPTIVDTSRCIAMFAITGVVNLIVLLFFVFGVIIPDFTAPHVTFSYYDRVDAGIRVMVLLASLVGLPVGFLLGREIPTSHEPSSPNSTVGDQ